jgi:hypothetical protein
MDLKLRYFDGVLDIEGKVPVPEPVQVSGSNRRKCNSTFAEIPNMGVVLLSCTTRTGFTTYWEKTRRSGDQSSVSRRQTRQ